MPNEPLSPIDAQKLIRAIVATGVVVFGRHAIEDKLPALGLTQADAIQALKSGIVEPAEFEHGEWRYRVHTQRIWVVVAFRNERHLRVVTVWKVGR